MLESEKALKHLYSSSRAPGLLSQRSNMLVQVSESEKALKHLHSGSRAHSGSGLGRDEALQENGAQDLIRRSLPEGTTFSRSHSLPPASLLHLGSACSELPAQNCGALPPSRLCCTSHRQPKILGPCLLQACCTLDCYLRSLGHLLSDVIDSQLQAM